MKFWQILSIFRDEKNILKKVFSKNKDKNYYLLLRNIKEIVEQQNRNILDLEMDENILKELCVLSEKKIYFSQKDNKLYSFENRDAKIEIPLSVAIVIYDHDCIEEVFEKTEAKVMKR